MIRIVDKHNIGKFFDMLSNRVGNVVINNLDSSLTYSELNPTGRYWINLGKWSD